MVLYVILITQLTAEGVQLAWDLGLKGCHTWERWANGGECFESARLKSKFHPEAGWRNTGGDEAV